MTKEFIDIRFKFSKVYDEDFEETLVDFDHAEVIRVSDNLTSDNRIGIAESFSQSDRLQEYLASDIPSLFGEFDD